MTPKPINVGDVVTAGLLNDFTGVLDRSLSTVDIVSTNAETTLWSKQVAAGAMSTNRLLRATLAGDYLNNTGAVQALTVSVKFGGTTILKDAIGDLGDDINFSANRRPFGVELWVANLDSATTQRAFCKVWLGSIAGATTGIGDLSNMVEVTATSQENAPVPGILASSSTHAIDTTAAKTLLIAVTHSASDANLSCRKHFAYLELL